MHRPAQHGWTRLTRLEYFLAVSTCMRLCLFDIDILHSCIAIMDDILFGEEYIYQDPELIVSEDDALSHFDHDSDGSEENLFDDELVDQFDHMHVDEDLLLSNHPDVFELQNNHPVYIPPVIPLKNRSVRSLTWHDHDHGLSIFFPSEQQTKLMQRGCHI
jgi:hypothetical protein